MNVFSQVATPTTYHGHHDSDIQMCTCNSHWLRLSNALLCPYRLVLRWPGDSQYCESWGRFAQIDSQKKKPILIVLERIARIASNLRFPRFSAPNTQFAKTDGSVRNTKWIRANRAIYRIALEKAVAVSGVCSGVPEENSGPGFGAPRKANLPRTLGQHCPGPCRNLLCEVLFFLEIDSYNLLEFFF